MGVPSWDRRNEQPISDQVLKTVLVRGMGGGSGRVKGVIYEGLNEILPTQINQVPEIPPDLFHHRHHHHWTLVHLLSLYLHEQI